MRQLLDDFGLVYLLINDTFNHISVIYVTAHRCAGRLTKKLDLQSGSHAIDILQGSLMCAHPSTDTGPIFLLLDEPADLQSKYS